MSTDEGAFELHVSEGGEPARLIAPSMAWMAVAGLYANPDLAGLSADGSLLAVQHAEHGHLMHPALRILDPRTGAVVAETRRRPVGGGGRRLVAGSRRPAARRDPRARGPRTLRRLGSCDRGVA